MRSRVAVGLGTLVLAVALGACANKEERAALPGVCQAGPDAIRAALQQAPRTVRLADGTPISECVRRAREVSELQSVGSVLTTVADALAVRGETDPGAALQLGYLLGAAREGSSTTEGIALELARRLDRTAVGVANGSPAVQAALERGDRAGARTG